MNWKSVIVLMVILFLTGRAPLDAQSNQAESPPDYRVNADAVLSSDERTFIITVTVYNSGGPAEQDATIQLINLRNGEVIPLTDAPPVRPLTGGGDSVEVIVELPVETFEAGSSQSLWVTVGVGEVEAEDSTTVLNNRAGLNLAVPNYTPRPLQPAPTAPGQNPPAEEASSRTAVLRVVIPVIDREVRLDLSDPRIVLALVGIITALLLMVWILSLIVRLLFRRTPTFGSWQPPYATVPPLDPNSLYGRRQLWQQHAQNNALPVPCSEGGVHARKLLMGMDGYYLSGWSFKAVRLTQYDMYGRVARSQVFASAGDLARLNRLARRNSLLNAPKMARRLRPVGRTLASQFKKRLTPRSAMLPIALDVRVQGIHGEVRIIFELYQCFQRQLQQVDIWEPEMTVLGRTIQESYTLTIFGQLNTESYRAFKGRLQSDIINVLTEMLLPQMTVSGSGQSTHDTLAGGTHPIQVNRESSAI